MKKLFFIVAILATGVTQNLFAQDSTKESKLLHAYYDIKNALVSGNATIASASAAEFVNTLNSIDGKVLPEPSRAALLKDATHISQSKDIKHQRDHLVTLSDNMLALAKTIKLSSQPIYEAYCPMKKAYWLTSEKAIKNPYFGSAMLTCGSIKETLK